MFEVTEACHPESPIVKNPNPAKPSKSPCNPTQSDVTVELEPIFQATDDDLDPLFFAPLQEQV